jgi:hypothetical protein
MSANEEYSPGWATVKLSVSPDGEMHALGGDRGPGDPDTDRAYIGLERIHKFYARRSDVSKSAQNVLDLTSTEGQYKDVLNQLGVQGHAGAVNEIRSLCNKAGLEKSGRVEKLPADKGRLVFTLDTSKINDLQIESINQVIPRTRQAHHTDISIRINGTTESWQADWIKHLVPVSNTKTVTSEENKVFTVISLNTANRMLRIGFGKHNNKWFVRVDLWFKAFRLAQV